MTKISNLYSLTNYISANSSGNVVIAAPASGYALELAGNGYISKAYSNTSDMQLVLNGNISGINIRSSQGGRFTIAQSYIAADITSFFTSTGTSNPSVEAIRIANGTGAINFVGNVSVGNTQANSNFTVSETTTGNPTREFNVNTGTSGVVRVFAYNRNTGPVSLALQDPGGNVGIGLTNPQTQLHINGVMTFSESGFDTARLHKIDHSHSDGNSVNNNLRFLVSDGSGTTDERVRLNGLGNVLIGTTADSKAKLRVAGNIRMGASAVSGLVRSFYAVQIGNNITFDVFRWLDDSGSVIGNGAIAGSLYLTFSDTVTGGNQIQYEYRILSNGNGTSDATLTQVGYQLRGTQPITSVQLVNDGGAGGIKVRGTVVSSGVSGCSVWGTFIGNTNG